LLYSRYYPAEQDAKGGIDAIFATIKRYLYAMQNRGIDTATPRQLFENLSSRPHKNFKNELFEIDRTRIEDMINHPDHALALQLFSRLKRFGEAVFDGTTLQISEYHGRVDLTIVFDKDFVPTIVSSANAVLANEGETVDVAGNDMVAEEVEAAVLERAEEDDYDSHVSFQSEPITESHVNKETVTMLPLTNTLIRRLPDGFKADGTDSRTRTQARPPPSLSSPSIPPFLSPAPPPSYTFSPSPPPYSSVSPPPPLSPPFVLFPPTPFSVHHDQRTVLFLPLSILALLIC
jgi:hypothetical protein